MVFLNATRTQARGAANKKQMVKTKTLEKQIKISSDVRFIQDVRQTVLSAMNEFEFDDDSKMSVAVALDECLSNAINHGNGSKTELLVNIKFRISPEKIEIVIRDQGCGFDWKKNQRLSGTADFTGYEVNGRGLFMIQNIMSSIKFNGAGNEVTITKNRR